MQNHLEISSKYHVSLSPDMFLKFAPSGSILLVDEVSHLLGTHIDPIQAHIGSYGPIWALMGPPGQVLEVP